ncbi:multiheme c-type cytochrome [Ferrimonas senticii]|uniref:multiheme c-type cytochrome n=1 Tax=Ferrimonas senticii TaxID=394566 RepID=UPI0004853D7C|nr:hypothetical protein [Ferrimonas senticii]
MKKNQKNWRLTLLAAAIATGLTACGGSDGNPGEPGRPGGEPAEVITELHLAITDIKQVDGVTEVTVLATNEEDLAVVGLTALQLRQYQLYPQGYASSGDSARWASNGRFTEYSNNGDGTYTFSLAGLENDASLTQRYNIISNAVTLAGGTEVPHQEISLDFSGTGGNAGYTKQVVSQVACEQCHNPAEPIARRHSGFFEVETCASCHNETSMQDERASFQHLVHAIHNDSHSFSDSKGNLYDGVAAEALLNNDCRTCHLADEQLAEANNWNRVPTKQTCSGCHNDGYADSGAIIHLSHLANQTDNTSCAACHSVDEITAIHVGDLDLDKQAAQSLTSQLSLTAAANGDVTATLQLFDANGAKVDANDYADSLDFVEVIGNVNPQATQLNYGNKRKLAVRGNGDDSIANYLTEAGTIATSFSQMLAGEYAQETALVIAGIRFCAADGAFVPCGEHDTYISIDSAAATVAMEGVTLKSRHYDSVDSNSCATCHGETFQIHNSFVEESHHAGFTFNQQMQVGDCAACHNTHGTYAGGANMGAIEMKLHKTHKSQAIVSDCSQCHTSFNVDSFDDKTPLATSGGLYSSPWAATCGSCHDFAAQMQNSNGTVGEHMSGKGAVLNQLLDNASSAETCANCHGKGKMSDHHFSQF